MATLFLQLSNKKLQIDYIQEASHQQKTVVVAAHKARESIIGQSAALGLAILQERKNRFHASQISC